jgi:hypothetical protein
MKIPIGSSMVANRIFPKQSNVQMNRKKHFERKKGFKKGGPNPMHNPKVVEQRKHGKQPTTNENIFNEAVEATVNDLFSDIQPRDSTIQSLDSPKLVPRRTTPRKEPRKRVDRTEQLKNGIIALQDASRYLDDIEQEESQRKWEIEQFCQIVETLSTGMEKISNKQL